MLATLSATFTSMAEDSLVLAPVDQQRVATALEDDAEFMSNSGLEEVLVGEPAPVQDEIVRINTDARPFALQIGLLVPIIAAIAGLVIAVLMMRLPDQTPSRPREGVDLG